MRTDSEGVEWPGQWQWTRPLAVQGKVPSLAGGAGEDGWRMGQKEDIGAPSERQGRLAYIGKGLAMRGLRSLTPTNPQT